MSFFFPNFGESSTEHVVGMGLFSCSSWRKDVCLY